MTKEEVRKKIKENNLESKGTSSASVEQLNTQKLKLLKPSFQNKYITI